MAPWPAEVVLCEFLALALPEKKKKTPGGGRCCMPNETHLNEASQRVVLPRQKLIHSSTKAPDSQKKNARLNSNDNMANHTVRV